VLQLLTILLPPLLAAASSAGRQLQREEGEAMSRETEKWVAREEADK
jgi:hypothetical protein